MKLSEKELADIHNDLDAPLFERKLARAIKNGNWREIDGMINQVYGKPKESVDMTSLGKSINPYAELSVGELKKLAGK